MTKKQRIIVKILEDEKGCEDFARIAKRITVAIKPTAPELRANNELGDDTDPNAPPTKPGK